MVAIAIILLFGFLMYVTGSNGEWGPFILALVLLIGALGLISADKDNAKAYNNFVDYWAEGGPDKKK